MFCWIRLFIFNLDKFLASSLHTSPLAFESALGYSRPNSIQHFNAISMFPALRSGNKCFLLRGGLWDYPLLTGCSACHLGMVASVLKSWLGLGPQYDKNNGRVLPVKGE